MRTGCLCISIESLCHVIRINNIRGFFFHFFCFCFYLLLTCHMGWLSTRFSCHFNATFLNLFLLHCFPFACSAFISIHTPANQPCHLLWKSVHGMKYVYVSLRKTLFFSVHVHVLILFVASTDIIFFEGMRHQKFLFHSICLLGPFDEKFHSLSWKKNCSHQWICMANEK